LEYRVLSENSDYFEVQFSVLAETEKAICFDASRSDIGNRPVWLPKSQMIIVDGGNDFGKRYFAKRWFSIKIYGLKYYENISKEKL